MTWFAVILSLLAAVLAWSAAILAYLALGLLAHSHLALCPRPLLDQG